MSSQGFDRFIAKLDSFLSQGSTNRFNVFSRYSYHRAQPDYNEGQFLQEQQAIFKKWNREVEAFLTLELGIYHLSFHFDLLKRPTIVLGGMPMQMSELILTYEAKLFALEDIILRLEERQQLMVRKEISEKEHEADVLYKVTFSEHTREIKVNDILLCRMDFESENHRVLSYIFANPNKTIGMEELESSEVNGGPLKKGKRLSDIVRDAGFVNHLRVIFFPVVQKDKVMFINPITRKYAIDNDLPPLSAKDLGRQREVKGAKK